MVMSAPSRQNDPENALTPPASNLREIGVGHADDDQLAKFVRDSVQEAFKAMTNKRG